MALNTIMPKVHKNKFVRVLIILVAIYIAWSIIVNLFNLDKNVDDEALVPCLMFLPPLGFLGLGLVAIKVIESAIVVRFLKKVFSKKNKQSKTKRTSDG